MRRGRIFLFLILILLIGGCLILYTMRNVLMPSPAATPTSAYVKVFIAQQSIPYGAQITEELLGTIELPPDRVLAAYFTEAEKADLVGKVARYPLEQGVILTEGMVAVEGPAPTGPTFTASIPPGMNAISIPITRLAAVSYGVTDNAHVNVIGCVLIKDVDQRFQSELPNKLATVQGSGRVTQQGEMLPTLSLSGPEIRGRIEPEEAFQFREFWFVVPQEPQRPRATCQMLLQDIVVLKIGNFDLAAAQAQPAAEQQPTPVPQQQQLPPPDVITLIVTPQDAVSLTWMLYNNFKFTLALRNSMDNSRVAVESATLQYIMSQYNFAIPAPWIYAIEPRVDDLTVPSLPNDTFVVPPQQ
ncbi:MAG: SAF domain-containing protein [Anaerolineales bacterium]